MRIFKKRFPWEIGATSFVLPAGMVDNVRFLADKVDDIQLLFFESPSNEGLENGVDKEMLKKLAGENETGFTVHLPTDIRPGNCCPEQRKHEVEVIAGLMADLDFLEPRCYDLHLPRQHDVSHAQWCDSVDTFLSMLKKEIGRQSRLVAIENINYPFAWIRSLVESHDLGVCLDVGHALFFGDDLPGFLADLSRTRHIHYHGISNNKDHQGLGPGDKSITEQLGTALQAGGFEGVVTIEVYNTCDLHDSLAHLETVWSGYDRQRGMRS